MLFRRVCLTVFLAVPGIVSRPTAGADSITIQGCRHDGVFVVEAGSFYRVYSADGVEVATVARQRMDVSDVRIQRDAPERIAFLEGLRESGAKQPRPVSGPVRSFVLRGDPAAAAAAMEAADAARARQVAAERAVREERARRELMARAEAETEALRMEAVRLSLSYPDTGDGRDDAGAWRQEQSLREAADAARMCAEAQRETARAVREQTAELARQTNELRKCRARQPFDR